ncbi:hypothetical protein HWV07_13380 [Natronomonas salina]|uniref:DUF7093 family protein n=1 Tax=Natronomonas salina TaxID=1710540 RepID=UPI0015B70840|nr:hypothetical protein [Natronomonas salina]QLD89968.1 hypothetical protein HWV07_13380 [Natronomonas salina]
MGLKCSFLGHSFEDAGVERDREEQGSEVVTVVKELEQCRRCGEERVVSESTEVTTVVDAGEVEADIDEGAAAGGTGGFGGAVDRAMDEGGDNDGAETLEEGPEPAGADDPAARAAADEAAAAVDELAEEPDEAFEERDPEEEDAEILTDDDDGGRDPGEWPDDHEEGEGLADDPEDAPDVPGSDDGAPVADAEERAGLGEGVDDDSLSGITVPEGRIVCPECGFEVDAESSYRDGDPCPKCGAWLTTVSE